MSADDAIVDLREMLQCQTRFKALYLDATFAIHRQLPHPDMGDNILQHRPP